MIYLQTSIYFKYVHVCFNDFHHNNCRVRHSMLEINYYSGLHKNLHIKSGFQLIYACSNFVKRFRSFQARNRPFRIKILLHQLTTNTSSSYILNPEIQLWSNWGKIGTSLVYIWTTICVKEIILLLTTSVNLIFWISV